ncbi:proteinase-activated receptor 1-like [Rhinoraja longicauda]
MICKVLLVLWVVLLPAVSSRKHGNRSRSNIGLRTFVSTKGSKPYVVTNCDGEGSGPCDGSGFGDGSGSGLDKNTSINFVRNTNEYPATISDTARQYLTSRWITVFVPSVYTGIFAVGLLFNCIAILTMYFKIKFDKPATTYLFNLAVADLLFLLLLPFKICYYFSGNNWYFGSFLCRMVSGGFYAYMCCSVLLMMCISVDRFVAVVFPIRSSSWRSPRRALGVCLLAWLLALGGAMPLFVVEQTVYVTNLNITTCHDVLPLSTQQTYFTYYFPVLCALFFFIPLVVTTVCYVGIISTLSSTNVANKCKKTSAIRLAVIVLLVLIVFFAPTNIILLIHYVHLNDAPDESLYFVYILCVCIGSLSCCLDPFIYYYASSLFQKHLKNLFCSREVAKPGSSQTGSKSCKTGTATNDDNGYRKLLV